MSLRQHRHLLPSTLVVLASLCLLQGLAHAQSFQPVSPDELKMTVEPQAPGAPAIILYRQVDRDDNGKTSHEDVYLRVKILTEEGLKYGSVEIPFDKPFEDVVHVRARTIKPNGTITEFKGEVFEKTIVKSENYKYLAKVFTLPDVEVGGIIEYLYTVDLSEHLIFDSHWIVSESLFTRTARFSLKPYGAKGLTVNQIPMTVRYVWQGLPAGVEPKEGPDHIVRLETHDIPAFQLEDHMPPPNQLKARVDFVYENEFMESDFDGYWRHVGKKYNEELEKFIGKRKAMEEAVGQIVSANDAPEVKLHKIYARVQEIRNKSYEIRKSQQEAKRENEKPDENVEDVWKRGYGSHRQLNWLFLALVRAAGFDACGVLVSTRQAYFFNPKSMERRKLNSSVVLVRLNGQERYFAPGAEFAPLGMLTWSETGVVGLCLDKDGGTWVKTSLPASSESRVEHKAQLKLDDTGALAGTVTITYTGMEAMYHRQDVRNADDIARKKFAEDRVKVAVPSAVEAELTNQPDWTSSDAPLVAEFRVKIPAWASNAGKRKLLPATMFSASEKKLFERETRVHPIYVRYPYEQDDDVTISLPEGWKVESVPAPQGQQTKAVSFSVKVEQDGNTVRLTRKLNRDFLLLDQKAYPALRNLIQMLRSADEQQIVLQPAATAGN
jgi:hypothetical protein